MQRGRRREGSSGFKYIWGFFSALGFGWWDPPRVFKFRKKCPQNLTELPDSWIHWPSYWTTLGFLQDVKTKVKISTFPLSIDLHFYEENKYAPDIVGALLLVLLYIQECFFFVYTFSYYVQVFCIYLRKKTPPKRKFPQKKTKRIICDKTSRVVLWGTLPSQMYNQREWNYHTF